jgi:hypothetical protein
MPASCPARFGHIGGDHPGSCPRGRVDLDDAPEALGELEGLGVVAVGEAAADGGRHTGWGEFRECVVADDEPFRGAAWSTSSRSRPGLRCIGLRGLLCTDQPDAPQRPPGMAWNERSQLKVERTGERSTVSVVSFRRLLSARAVCVGDVRHPVDDFVLGLTTKATVRVGIVALCQENRVHEGIGVQWRLVTEPLLVDGRKAESEINAQLVQKVLNPASQLADGHDEPASQLQPSLDGREV